MLSWLTGAKGADENEVADAFAEPPETPAPVFAVRAFKHAIFGTPAPTNDDPGADAKMTMTTTDDSRSDAQRTTTDEPKPYNPRVNVLRRSKDDLDALALPSSLGISPSKPNGILLTPGTTRRTKTVSFGEHVVDNEAKKQGRSGLPNTYPGKFPSPWTPKLDLDGFGQAASNSNRPRTKLTAQLHEVRDSAQKEKSEKIMRAKDDTDLTMDFMEPRSQSGKYWKREYESYSEKTQREMKKLVIKQKAAKDFAKEKEEQVVDLSSQLRQERSKVEKLEAKTKELATQMRDFEKKLLARTSQDARDEITRFRAENLQLRQDLDRALGKKSSIIPSPKRKSPKAAPTADIWADAVFSSPFVDELPADFKALEQSPLRARNLNILDSSTPKPAKNKATKGTHTKHPSLTEDTLDMSLGLPQPSPEPVQRATPRSSRKSAVDMTIEELVDKYSPEKPRAASPSAHFDRLAMPMGMGIPSFNPGPAQKKRTTQKTKNGSIAKSENTNTVTEQPKVENAVSAAGEAGKSSKKIISDERKAKAQARIAARKEAKAAS